MCKLNSLITTHSWCKQENMEKQLDKICLYTEQF